ncbi:MAG TPA: DUF1572 domain-containing protein [Chitinophagaceae bacterium]|nr:DUF1572 domain-containing protein [Chitinophagaceae bacterium]
MLLSSQIAKHFKEVFFGGNWTAVNLKDTLKDVTWQQATRKVHSCNTITALVYHINYYVSAVLKVLEGGPLDAHDKYSFDHPIVQSPEDWEALVNKTYTDAEHFAVLIEKIPESKFGETFADEKYGSYYRNLHGIIEHTHYHLGQIVILKKVIQSEEQES